MTALVATSCSSDIELAKPSVKSISVQGFENINYEVGDSIDFSNAKLLIVYTDGTVETIDITESMVDSSLDMNVPGRDKEVKISYGGATTTVHINIADLELDSVTLKSYPNKTVYIEGQNIETEGAVLKVNYLGGKSVDVKVTYGMLQSYDNSVGEKTILIDFNAQEGLTFTVKFLPRTVTKIELVREPMQTSVFQNYGANINTDGTKIRLTYDNDVQEIFENAKASPSNNYTQEQIASLRADWAEKVAPNLKWYVADKSVTSAATARICYIQNDITDEIAYAYDGVLRVKEGDTVKVGTVLATNKLIGETISKSEGKVVAAANGKITVSRFVDFDCNSTNYSVGQIISANKELGVYGSVKVLSTVSGIISSIDNGKVTVRALPCDDFTVSVVDRSFANIEIIKYPVTVKGSNINSIIQGDVLNLSTGRVRVTFNNGETEEYAMDNSLISVINGSNNQRMEIPGLGFEKTDDVTDIEIGGNYELQYVLKYEEGYAYDASEIKVTVTVVDENGLNIAVLNNRSITPERAKNYTVNIVVTYTPAGTKESFVSETSYGLSTAGATPKQDKLDISAVGRQTLKVIYGGIEDDFTPMEINVISKYPVAIILENDNISGKDFYLGNKISLSTIVYKLKYNNGDIDANVSGITEDMIADKSKLVCSEKGQGSLIIKYSYTDSDGKSQSISTTLYYNVIAVPITVATIEKEPDYPYILTKGTAGAVLDLTGARIVLTYLNGVVKRIDDNYNGNTPLNTLVANYAESKLPCIRLIYKDEDSGYLSPDDIYLNNKYYLTTLEFTDEYGEKATVDLRYYLIDPAVEIDTIKVIAKDDSYKKDYIQCEDFDLTNLQITVTYKSGGASQTFDAKEYMLYDTDTNTVGKDIPLRFRYLGKTESEPSIKINVSERVETGITVKNSGKNAYNTMDSGIDLKDYVFAINYNAGTSKEVFGVNEADTNNTVGWWYEIWEYDNNVLIKSTTGLRTEGNKVLRLYHTSVLHTTDGAEIYNTVNVDIAISVTRAVKTIASMSFTPADGKTYKDVPVLEDVPYNNPLALKYYDSVNNTLSPKILKVVYQDNTSRDVEITYDMLSYNKDDKTLGYREVEIKYEGKTLKVYVNIIDAQLKSISVVRHPVTNFITGASIDLAGGILCCTYTVNGSQNDFKKYIDIEGGEVSAQGFDSSVEAGLVYKTQSITLEYKTASFTAKTSYDVNVYNKLNVSFKYQNTIFFYGNTKEASVTAVQKVAEFELPAKENIKMYYVCNKGFIEDISNLSEQEKAKYSKVYTYDSEKNVIVRYVNLSDSENVSVTRFYAPAPSGYKYYLMMSVKGNDYYLDANYCYQEYLVIPKVVVVSVINATSDAYLMRYSTTNNPLAIKYLYNNLNTISAQYTDISNEKYLNFIQNVSLASPNAAYFEIIVYLNANFNGADTQIEKIKNIYSELEAVIEAISVEQSRLTLTRETSSMVKGVNISAFNGGNPTYISYSVEKDETLERNGVLELLSGKLELKVDGGRYGVGEYNVKVGTLKHNNYNIDLAAGDAIKYIVTQGRAKKISVNGLGDGAVTLTLSSGQKVIAYVVWADDSSKTLGKYELEYFTSSDYNPGNLLSDPPTSAGTYYVRLKPNYIDIVSGETITLQFTLIRN